jgi:hypothetical protein
MIQRRMGRGKINYNDKEHTFKRMFGVKIKTFKKMKEILEKEYGKMHKFVKIVLNLRYH